jgi:hypothetical protein
VKESTAQIFESEKELTATVKAVEEHFFDITGEKDTQFTVEDRLAVRNAIKKFSVESVLEAIPSCIKKYGEDAISRLNGFLNPKTKSSSYICGILKNKLKRYINTDKLAIIKQIVSNIVDEDNGKSDAVNYVIEQIKHQNLDTFDDYVIAIQRFGKLFFQVKLVQIPTVPQKRTTVRLMTRRYKTNIFVDWNREWLARWNYRHGNRHCRYAKTWFARGNCR